MILLKQHMLSLFEKADTAERNAIIKHIGSLLSTCNQDEKTFWMQFRRKLEKLKEPRVLFPLGSIYLTPGAIEALEEYSQQPFEFISRHQCGDYGNLCEDDQRENELSVREGFRILSSYTTKSETKIWIITEADRSSTTILLPSEY